jgi:hypothetical protein
MRRALLHSSRLYLLSLCSQARSLRGPIPWQAFAVCARVGVSPTSLRGGFWLNLCHVQTRLAPTSPQPEIIMGKYVLGWILGVPTIVLVIAYFFFH